MEQKISDKFTIKTMFLFALPCIGMQLVDNTYQVVDGFFISNYLGEEIFAAENMIFPPLSILMSIGLVVGAGGSAVISANLGEGKDVEARQALSMLSVFLFLAGAIVSMLTIVFMPQISRIAGATDELIPYCSTYGRILSAFMPVQMMNYAYQEYLVAADEGRLGLISSFINAITNIVLDYLFVVVFSFGLKGAAVATGIAYCCSFLVGFIYFLNKKHNLHLVPFHFDTDAIVHAVGNGSSEMVDSISYAVIAILFNHRLISMMGAKGVAAYAVTEYVTGVFYAVFVGFGIAMIPVFGYRYGERNFPEIERLRNEGIKITVILGVIMFFISIFFSPQISHIYVGYDPELFEMSVYALRVCGMAYLIVGINMFSSSFFTGISDGFASAMIAFSRSFVAPIVLVFLLPYLFGKEAIWYTTITADAITIILTVLLYKFRFKKICI